MRAKKITLVRLMSMMVWSGCGCCGGRVSESWRRRERGWLFCSPTTGKGVADADEGSVRAYLSDGFEVEVLGIEQSLRVADGRARDGDVHAAVCLVSRIKERYLGGGGAGGGPRGGRRAAAGRAGGGGGRGGGGAAGRGGGAGRRGS